MTFHKHNIFQLRSCHPVHIVDQLHRHACILYVDAACTRSLRANGNQRRTGCAIAICNERNTFLSTEQVPTERYGCHLIGRDGRRLEFVRRSAQNTRRHFLQSRALSAAWVSTLPQISVFTPNRFVGLICVTFNRCVAFPGSVGGWETEHHVTTDMSSAQHAFAPLS